MIFITGLFSSLVFCLIYAGGDISNILCISHICWKRRTHKLCSICCICFNLFSFFCYLLHLFVCFFVCTWVCIELVAVVNLLVCFCCSSLFACLFVNLFACLFFVHLFLCLFAAEIQNE